MMLKIYSISDKDGSWAFLLLAWMVSLASTLGAIFVGEIMGQAPCELCWYQRVAMFPLALILGIATYFDDLRVVRYAFPLAAAGWIIAVYHNLRYFDVIAEVIQPCGLGPSCSGEAMAILGGMPLPLLSLATFTLILICFTVICKRSSG